MDNSRDSGKRDNAVTDWTTNPFERVNHSTNFEDYAITSTDTSAMYDRTKQLQATNFGKANDIIKRDQMSNTFGQYLKAHKFEPKAFQLDHLADSGLSSTEVTPATTPQSSPYTLRKMFGEANKPGQTNGQTNNPKVANNTKRWFYNGFFGADDKSGSGPVPRNPSLKNLCISNFDINAVGPTSW